MFPDGFGRPLDAANVRRPFRRICAAAGVGDNWSPRELRYTFVSIMPDSGVPIERIADWSATLAASDSQRSSTGSKSGLYSRDGAAVIADTIRLRTRSLADG